MNKYKTLLLLFITSLIAILGYLAFSNDSNSNNNQDNKSNISENTNVDEGNKNITSDWVDVTYKTNITVSLKRPSNWFDTSDGFYNYDAPKELGLRDPNFPDNSFKCVFYSQESSDKYTITSSKTISENPTVKSLSVVWTDKVMPGPGQIPGGTAEVYEVESPNGNTVWVSCNVFKGVMTDENKKLLEQSLNTIK